MHLCVWRTGGNVASHILRWIMMCVLLTVQVLGFGEYIEEVHAAYEQHKLGTLVIIISVKLLALSKSLNSHSFFFIQNRVPKTNRALP